MGQPDCLCMSASQPSFNFPQFHQQSMQEDGRRVKEHLREDTEGPVANLTTFPIPPPSPSVQAGRLQYVRRALGRPGVGDRRDMLRAL
jgi:hypothetical protein